MFCDLVGSTPLAEKLDPEDFRSVLQDFQHACVDAVNRYEGHIAKYMGDGILIYFGYPLAHEDDARRAIQAGLAMLKSIEQISAETQQKHGVELKARIGVHTGLVVAGDMGEGEQFESRAIVGQTPNVAARLEAFAEPGTLVISAATHRLASGYFEYVDLGAHMLKGVSRPIEIYRVLSEGSARSRLEVAGLGGLTPLVGREMEVERLVQSWRAAIGGSGQSMLLAGDAGVGKSRLVHTLKEIAIADPEVWIVEARCSAFHTNSAFYPVIDLFERSVLQFGSTDSDDDKRKKLFDYLKQVGAPLKETVPLFASLLSIDAGPSYPAADPNPVRQKQRILEMLVGLLLARAARQPVLFIVEDLHWADPSTLELLSLAFERILSARVFAILTTRPEFTFTFPLQAQPERMEIERLPQSMARTMIRRVAGDKTLPDEVVNLLITKSDGVPLYVEEMTKMLLESGQLAERDRSFELTASLQSLAIPATLQDSLMARLDRLSTVKTVAQVGATLGREFSYDLIRSVTSQDDRLLQSDLAHLVSAEILYQRGEAAGATYTFKHALIQDAAYNSLLKTTRQQYHSQTANALLERFPHQAEAGPEIVAHHLTEAGQVAESLPYWMAAGQRAVQRSANLEAIAHLNRGLELLKVLPQSADRDQHELLLLTALGPALLATRGFGDELVGETYSRARALCGQSEETPQHFFVLWGLFAFYILRCDLATSEDLCYQMIRFAEKEGKSEYWLMARICLGANQFFQGDFQGALENARAAHGHYDQEEHRPLAGIYGQDSGVVSLTYVGLAQLYLGYPEQSVEMMKQAVALGEQVGFMFTLIQARVYRALVHMYRREWAEALSQAQPIIAQATEQVFPLWVAHSLMDAGLCQAKLGKIDEGTDLLSQGLGLWNQTGALLARSSFEGFLAELYGDAGRAEEALATLPKLFEHIEKSGERFMEADLYRIRGELLLKLPKPDPSGAEADFRKGIDVARGQAAKLLELRVALSLGSLLISLRRSEEARNLIEPICGRFTEGYDTPDLILAKSMLALLSVNSSGLVGVELPDTSLRS